MRGILLLLPLTVFAGQSLVLTPGTTGSVTDPNVPSDQSRRIEFQLHNWTLPPQGVAPAFVFNFNGAGAAAIINPDGSIALIDWRLSVEPAQPCFLTLNGRQNVLIRFQRDIANKRVVCEIWNADGTGYQQDSDTITAAKPAVLNGGTLGSASTNASLGFLRVLSTIVPDGDRPPVTADTGDLMNLTFDSGTGSSSVSVAGGSYAPTPGQKPIAFAKTYGAPFWNNWVSLRAGFPAQLDGSHSYSLADGSSDVTYQWGQISGPSTVRWSDTTSATPTIEGLIFGTYTFQLTVKDSSGATASTTLQVGAVATDANGVVVQADPNADKLFGPMIAFGQNPWGYADERALRATTLRSAAYDAMGLSNPTWETALPGTVTYNFTPPFTTVAAGISSTAMSIPVSDVTQLDLSTFPTRILVGSFPFEEVRICSVTGNTLQVCYDGRGFRTGTGYHVPSSAWGSGTRVYQTKVKGAGTQFLKDFCPAGAGWTGLISYQDGTVTVTPGSSLLIGNGTLWSSTNAGGRAIRIEGTHNGGIPFVFESYVSTVNSATSLTLSRPWPSDADPGNLKYALVNGDTRNFTPHYTRNDGTEGIIYFSTSGCESDTALYLYMWWDNGITGVQADKQYGYMDGAGYVGDFGPNFYDEVLANYALYYRSGWTPAREAARKIGDHWLDYPEIANGDAGGQPRRMAVIGAFANTVLDGRTKNWSGLRTLANWGVRAIKDDCNQDVRENAFELSWLALAALFDPVDTGSSTEPNQRSYWKSKLADAAARDASCAGSDHSWKTGFYWNPYSYPSLKVTNGSAIATGTNLPASMCPYVANGTGIATANSAVISGAGFQAGAKIMITGTRFGQPYTGGFEFRADNPNQITLSVLWPGDSGSISWMVETDQNYTTIAVDNNDPRFGQIWACRWDNPSQITLNRPWVGNGTETVGFSRYNLIGRGVQPFMLGIKTLQMTYGSLIDDPTTASIYKDLAAGAAGWISNVGYDPILKAVSYGRIFPQCEPPMTETGDPTFVFRLPGCIENSANPYAVASARARNSEAQNAFRTAYQANPTSEVKAVGDEAYCAQWGKSAMTRPGYCTEAVTASNVDDGSLGAYKYTGFFFGVGMAHQWPAARVGGVSPAIPQSVSVDLDLSQAASARVTVTQPSSATTQYLCSSSPCQVVVDARQGAHWAQIDYLSSSGEVLSSPPPVLLSATGVPITGTEAIVTPAPVTTVTASPSFNLAGGSYTSTQSVTISTTTAGATIRYTTDGTTPTSTVGTVYSGPVNVSSSLTLKAIAYASGMTNSSVTTATYTIAAAVTGSGTGTSGVSVAGGVAWYDTAWTKRKAITIDRTKVAGAGNLTNFPMLFSVADPDLKAVAYGGSVGKFDGTDILFTASDGVTKLDHELDGFISATGQVNAWVRLPALSPGADTVIYVYYGNATAADQQNRTAVWDSNYKLVWHLGDGSILTGMDSTSNNAGGASYGGAGLGKIAGGAAGVVETVANGLVIGDQTRTMECWFKITGNTGSDQVICGMGYDTGTGSIFSLMYRAAGSQLSLDAKGIARSFPWTYDSNWHHFAATYTAGSGLQNAALYLDGVQQGTSGGSGTLVAQWPTYFDVQHSPAYPWNDMTGTVDEFRVSGIARPAAWILTEYNNQSSPGTFFNIGTQELQNSSQSAQVPMPALAPAGGSYSSAQLVTISTSTAGASIRYTIDGTTPSATVGTVYSGPVSVSSSLTLKAIAFKSGMTNSSVMTATYTIAGAVTGGVSASGGTTTPVGGTQTAGGSGSAAFVKTDTTTQGRWKGVYGSQGYNVLGDTVSYPGYVTVTPAGQSNYVWAGSTSDVRALQKALSSTDRTAAAWYTYSSYTIDLNFNDGALHQLAVYCLDWDWGGARAQTFSILDSATSAVLDSQSVTKFQNGKYLVWNLTGHVILRVTNTGPVNAVVGGLFFDPASGSGTSTPTVATSTVAAPTFVQPGGNYSSAQSVTMSTTTAGATIRYTTDGTIPSATVGNVYGGPVSVSSSLTIKAIAYKTGMTDSSVSSASYVIAVGGANSAAFLKTDTTTQGSWKGVYGSQGYNVIYDTASYPGYVTATPAGQMNFIWASSTNDVRGLQKALSSTDRIAADWFTYGSYTVDLNFNDGAQHQLAVYCLDWDWGGARAQTVSILDGVTSAVLDSQSVTKFQNGKYLVWNVTGHVILRVTNTGPINAVIGGLFFDPAGH